VSCATGYTDATIQAVVADIRAQGGVVADGGILPTIGMIIYTLPNDAAARVAYDALNANPLVQNVGPDSTVSIY
jgi:hypothetical protein